MIEVKIADKFTLDAVKENTDRIDTTISSRASANDIDTILEQVTALSVSMDTGDKSFVEMLSTVGIVKSIQRGNANIGTGVNTGGSVSIVNVTISSVNISKSILIINQSSQDVDNSLGYLARATLASNSITFTRSASNYKQTTIAWQVIELY